MNQIAANMHRVNPHTFVAMQHLVMSMDDCAKNIGKKSWFGKDKGVDSYMNFKQQITRSIAAMTLDGLVSETMNDKEVSIALFEQLTRFSEAFPQWTTAYAFWLEFANHGPVIETIGRAR